MFVHRGAKIKSCLSIHTCMTCTCMCVFDLILFFIVQCQHTADGGVAWYAG